MLNDLDLAVGNSQEIIKALYSQPIDIMTPERDETLVIMAHDFPGSHKKAHEDLYGELEFMFNNLGFHTLRFDFRGCGQSEGVSEKFTLKTANEDFHAILEWARENMFKRFIYIAEGLAAALSFKNMNDDVGLMILFWPVIDLPLHADQRFGLEEDHVMLDANARYVTIENHKVGIDLINEMAVQKVEDLIPDLQIPVLVHHGTDDKMISIEQLDILKDHIQARRLDMTSFQGGDYGITDPKQRKMMLYHIQQIIEKYT